MLQLIAEEVCAGKTFATSRFHCLQKMSSGPLLMCWLKLVKKWLELVREEKSALMSQLLTGKRRVKSPEAEMEAQA